jgi:hypothetical protein
MEEGDDKLVNGFVVTWMNAEGTLLGRNEAAMRPIEHEERAAM